MSWGGPRGSRRSSWWEEESLRQGDSQIGGWRHGSSGGGAPAQGAQGGGWSIGNRSSSRGDRGSSSTRGWSSGWGSGRGSSSSAGIEGEPGRGRGSGRKRKTTGAHGSESLRAFGRIDPVSEDDTRYLIRMRWPGPFFTTLPPAGEAGDLASLKAAATELEAELVFRERGNRLPRKKGGLGARALRDTVTGNTGGHRGNFLTVIAPDVDSCRELVMKAIRSAEMCRNNSAATIRWIQRHTVFQGCMQDGLEFGGGAPTPLLALTDGNADDKDDSSESYTDASEPETESVSETDSGTDIPDENETPPSISRRADVPD